MFGGSMGSLHRPVQPARRGVTGRLASCGAHSQTTPSMMYVRYGMIVWRTWKVRGGSTRGRIFPSCLLSPPSWRCTTTLGLGRTWKQCSLQCGGILRRASPPTNALSCRSCTWLTQWLSRQHTVRGRSVLNLCRGHGGLLAQPRACLHARLLGETPQGRATGDVGRGRWPPHRGAGAEGQRDIPPGTFRGWAGSTPCRFGSLRVGDCACDTVRV